MGAQHLPGEGGLGVGEHRSTGERKYYLANLPADTLLKQFADDIKARWVCEQAHKELKEERTSTISRGAHGRVWTGTR